MKHVKLFEAWVSDEEEKIVRGDNSLDQLLSDEEYVQSAVDYLNHNGFAYIVSDGEGGWLVDYLDGEEDHKKVKYDSQGVVYFALDKRFDRE
jgi:hypothetical protein